ncbi:hypothetical protein FKM82_009910 [Ascaphus truei]
MWAVYLDRTISRTTNCLCSTNTAHHLMPTAPVMLQNHQRSGEDHVRWAQKWRWSDLILRGLQHIASYPKHAHCLIAQVGVGLCMTIASLSH